MTSRSEHARPGPPPPASHLSPFHLAVGSLWGLGFIVLFFMSDLSNNRQFDRLSIALLTPELITGPFLPEGAGIETQVQQWSHLADRGSLLGCAITVWALAWCWGTLLARRLPNDRDCTRLERGVFRLGLGLATLSLLTLMTGWLGGLSRLTLGLVCGLAPIGLAVDWGLGHWSTLRTVPGNRATLPWLLPHPILLTAVPFVFILLLGALLPSLDFDVNEYHFQGPKEFLEAGRILWLPHNVYTSFPFATEMLTLLSMVFHGDWYSGAVAGKCVLAAFGPLTALALLALGRRLYDDFAGALAAVIWLASPWQYRIGTIAYAEGGLTFYLTATLLAFVVWRPRPVDVTNHFPLQAVRDRPVLAGVEFQSTAAEASSGLVLAGLFAGTALACKYPGLVSVVVPCFLAVMGSLWHASPGSSVLPRFRRVALGLTVLLAGVACTCGPWLLKNLWETGNPVYPLAWGVFGGADWDAELDARWRRAHSSSDFSPASVWALVLEMTLRNDWQSPLQFALAPLALLAARTRRTSGWLWLFVAWQFVTCWGLTHRLDRFWVPLSPVVALLAGAGGADWWRSLPPGPATRSPMPLPGLILKFVGVPVAAGLLLLYCFAFCVSPLGGYNGYLQSFEIASRFAARHTAPELVELNSRLPPGSRVLAVGDAEMFEARFPVVYNTVFDHSIFEEWCGVKDWPAHGTLPDGTGGDHANRPFRPTDEIRARLDREGVTHVYVNWLEVLRYRSPGNYGYTRFVEPRRFTELQRLGILGPAWRLDGATIPLEQLDEGRRNLIAEWGGEPTVRIEGQPHLRTFDVFPVSRRGRKSDGAAGVGPK